MRETKFWLINIVCGVVILAFLGMHMAIMHLDDLLALLQPALSEPLTWPQVSGRGESGFFTLTYVLLLGTALFHGLYGVRTMLTEFWSGERAARVILLGCWATGSVLFGVGTVATVVFHVTGATQ